MSEWLRRLMARREPQHDSLLDALRAVAFGDEADAERAAAAWARRRADEERERQEREAYERQARELRERVMRGPGWFPGDGW